MRRFSIVVATGLAALTLPLAAGCGDESEQTTSTSHTAGSLDEVVQEFGRAYVKGDTETLLSLLKPQVVDGFSEEELDSLTGLGEPSSQVELRGFSSEIVERSDTTASAVYSGERCAPTVVNEFPETTAAGGPGDLEESVSEGSLTTGDVVCHDIAERFERIPPVEFVQVGDRWYGTLPGLT